MGNPFPETTVGNWLIAITDEPASFVQDWIQEVLWGWHTTLPDTAVQRHGQADGVGELWEGFAFAFGGMREPFQLTEHDPNWPKVTLTITFDPNPSPDVSHELAYTTAVGAYQYVVTLKDDLHELDRGPGQPVGGEHLVRDVVAHELGHVIVLYLMDVFGVSQTEEALCEIFDAPLVKWNNTDDPWRERVVEGVCETFKDAILKPTFATWMNTRDNRTDWQLAEAKWEDWVEWMHKRPKQLYDWDKYDIMGHFASEHHTAGWPGLPASHGAGETSHYPELYAEGEVTFFDDPASPWLIGPAPATLDISFDLSFDGGAYGGWGIDGYDDRDSAWDDYLEWPYIQLVVAFYGEGDSQSGFPVGIDPGLINASPGDIGFQGVSKYGLSGVGLPTSEFHYAKSVLFNENDSALYPPGDPAAIDRFWWTANPHHLTAPVRQEFRGNDPALGFAAVYEDIPHNTDIEYHSGPVFEASVNPPTVTGAVMVMKWAFIAWFIPRRLFRDPPGSTGVPNYWHNLPRLPYDMTFADQGTWQKPTWPYAEFPPYFTPTPLGKLSAGPSLQQIRRARQKRRLVQSIKDEFGWE